MQNIKKNLKKIILTVSILIALAIVIFTISSIPSNKTMEESIVVLSSSNIAGIYEKYNTDRIQAVTTDKIILFFKASWCITCKKVDQDIQKNKNNIPENTTLLEVDYDNSSELKKRYGVTTQHTFVQIDKDGNMIKKWSGGSTLDSVISQIQ